MKGIRRNIRRMLTGIIAASMILTAFPGYAYAAPDNAAYDEHTEEALTSSADTEQGVQDEEVLTTEETTDQATSEDEETVSAPADDEETEAETIDETTEPEPVVEEQATDEELLGAKTVTEYELWLGSTQVTSANCRDLSDAVRGPGASASFDPSTNTLTLHNVTGINGIHNNYTDSGSLYGPYMISSKIDLKLRGDAQMSSERGIFVDGDLDIEGTFSISTKEIGILNLNDTITVHGEETNLRVHCDDDYAITTSISGGYVQNGGKVEVEAEGSGAGLISDNVTITGGIFHVIGENQAIVVGTAFNMKGVQITCPDNGKYDSTKKTIIDSEDNNAKEVRIEKAYDLWVGSTRVTEQNCDDLVSAGAVSGPGAKASFDPETNTLTLHNVTGINGMHSPSDGSYGEFLISSEDMNLKLRGDAKLKTTEDYGVLFTFRKTVNIEGDFSFDTKSEPAISAINTHLTVSGTDTHLKINVTNNIGLYTKYFGSYTQTGGIVEVTASHEGISTDKVTVSGGQLHVKTTNTTDPEKVALDFYGGSTDGRFVLGDGFVITCPDGGKYNASKKTIVDSAGNAAKEVQIEKAYDLWVGSTRVTENNCWDLSEAVTGEGAAAYFDPSTNTLTLRNVTGFNGSKHIGEIYADSCIYSEFPLKLRGDGVLSPDDSGHNLITSYEDLDVQGRFTLKNANRALYAYNGDLTISGTGTEITVLREEGTGGFSALSSGNGKVIIEAGTLDLSGSNNGIFSNKNDIIINGGSVTASGSECSMTCAGDKDIILGKDVEIVSPENASIQIPAGKSRKTICNSGGSPANTVVIESNVESFTVSFKLCGKQGIQPADQIVKEGMKAVKPDTQVSGGYKIAGWLTDEGETYDFDTPVTESMILYADWVPADRYTVTFGANGKAASGMPAEQNVTEGDTVTEPAAAPVAAGSVFAGWYTDAACTTAYNFDAKVYSDITLYAKWISSTANIVTVSFDMGGFGIKIPTQKIESGKKPVQPSDPTDKEKVFAGWFTSAEHDTKYDFKKAVTENTTVYAYWVDPDPKGFITYFDLSKGSLSYNAGCGRYEYVYTGDKIMPKVTVTNQTGTDVLIEGVDYTVKYSNNQNVDKKGKPAVVTVTGKGNYAGSKSLQFYVLAKSIGNGTSAPASGISLSEIYVADGNKADPIIYYNGNRLKSKDYTLTSSTGSVKYKATDVAPKLTISGKGNFSGTIKDVPVNVVTKSVLKQYTIKVSVKNASGIVYNGKPQTLSAEQLVVQLGDNTAANPAGYSVTYYNNVNAGTAKVIVTGGFGMYTGTASKTFKILPDKNISEMEATLDTATVSYVNGGAKPNVTVSAERDGSKKTLTAGTDYKVTYSGNTKMNPKAKYKVSFIGNYAGQPAINGEFSVTAAALDTKHVTAIAPDMIFTKSAKYLSVPFVAYDGIQLKKGKDYDVNYYIGEKEISKENIKQEDIPKSVKIVITGKGNYTGTLEFDNSYTIKLAPDNGIDLSKAKITMKGDIKKAIPAQTYTGAAIEPAFDVFVQVGSEWKTAEAAGLEKDTDYSVFFMNNTQKGTATVGIIALKDSPKVYKSKTATFKIGTWSFSNLIQMIIKR